MRFDPISFQSMISGLSTLDIPHLQIQTLPDAHDFIRSYGYDVNQPEDLSQLWSFHRQSVLYVQQEILQPGEQIPEVLTHPQLLGDIGYLLIYASHKDVPLQKWACALLKVIHVFVHLENDLFAQFSSEIQEQILKPIREHIQEDPILGTVLGPTIGAQSIIIQKFEEKLFKTNHSSVTKLLAKPDLVAFSLMDKIGIRIVTKRLIDVFRVLRYLVKHNIINFAHNIPDQSINTLYPLNLFVEVVDHLNLSKDYTAEEVDILLKEKLNQFPNKAQFKVRKNQFTSPEYRFIKFITRRLVRLNFRTSELTNNLNFFYPYEVQIVDYESYIQSLQGEGSHEKYKSRQINYARRRIFGLDAEKG